MKDQSTRERITRWKLFGSKLVFLGVPSNVYQDYPPSVQHTSTDVMALTPFITIYSNNIRVTNHFPRVSFFRAYTMLLLGTL